MFKLRQLVCTATWLWHVLLLFWLQPSVMNIYLLFLACFMQSRRPLPWRIVGAVEVHWVFTSTKIREAITMNVNCRVVVETIFLLWGIFHQQPEPKYIKRQGGKWQNLINGRCDLETEMISTIVEDSIDFPTTAKQGWWTHERFRSANLDVPSVRWKSSLKTQIENMKC